MRPLLRALSRRCPRCGYRPVFDGWWTMVDDCPGCRLRFEREHGYWVGAMTLTTGATIAVFLATLGIGIALTWPEVPWPWLTAATIGVNLVVPLLAYPFAKTVWLALDLAVRRPG